MQECPFQVMFDATDGNIELIGNFPLLQAFKAAQVKHPLAQGRQLRKGVDKQLQLLLLQRDPFGTPGVCAVLAGIFRPFDYRIGPDVFFADMVAEQIHRSPVQITFKVIDFTQVINLADLLERFLAQVSGRFLATDPLVQHPFQFPLALAVEFVKGLGGVRLHGCWRG